MAEPKKMTGFEADKILLRALRKVARHMGLGRINIKYVTSEAGSEKVDIHFIVGFKKANKILKAKEDANG